ncbi:ABC transporter substrate-binding protein [Acidovorax sp. SRB_24]|uniref:ABC transporter substrate-binding protein n=1 Tax=Acidovorax sp. SRB_24 TaxID=1962700 RepID=UPI00145F6C02|nr:ABC transporter substrate-binding protein [Acidovorax sp. SRB_24]
MSSDPISRRAFGALSAATAAAWAPAVRAALPGADATAARLTVAMGPRSAFVFRHLPTTLALQLGFFADEGVELAIETFASDALALRAMHAGAADVCATDFEQLLRTPGDAPLARAFVLQGRAPQAALGVSAKSLPHFTALSDLRQRKVGVAALGSLSHTTARLALAQAGLGPGDVSLVAVGEGRSAAAALRAGRVQALCHGDPLMALLEQRGDVRIVSDARTLRGAQALFGGSVPGGCLVAPAAFLQKRAPEAQALANGVVHALKWLQTAAPADLVKAVPPQDLGADRSLYLAAFARARETISPDGVMPLDAPATALRALLLAEPGRSRQRVDVQRWVAPEFARKAKQKFSA